MRMPIHSPFNGHALIRLVGKCCVVLMLLPWISPALGETRVNSSGTAWMNNANWTTGKFAGVDNNANSTVDGATDDVAQFSRVMSGNVSFGINMNTSNATGDGTNTGANTLLRLGAIEYLNTNGSTLTIGKSDSTVANSTLRLNGAAVNPGTGVVSDMLILISDAAGSNLTISNTAGGTGSMALQLGGTTGTIYVASGRLLTINSNVTELWAGSGFVKTGAGTVRLVGTNSFTGGITINAGVVQVHGAGALNSNAVNFTGNSTLEWNSASTGPSPGAISIANGVTAALSTNSSNPVLTQAVGGQGNFEKQTAGTITFAADNTYAGTTLITQGTLQVGNGGTTGTLGGGAVTNNAAVTFNRSNAYTVANRISGSGAVNLLGTGAMTFPNGLNAYTGVTSVSNGTLLVGADVATGWNFANGNVSADNDTITVAGNTLVNGDQVAISGTGTVGGLNYHAVYYVVNKSGSTVQLSATPGGAAVDLTGTTGASGANKIIGKVGALGASNAAVVLGDAATGGGNTINLLSSAGITFARPITVANFGAGTTIGGSTDANTTFIGTIALGKAVTLTSAATGGNAVEYAGDISGAFDVGVSGSGVTRFAGIKTYSGATTVGANATLLVNGGLATSGVNVSGRLGGTGNFTAAVAATGVIAPGVDGVTGQLATGTVTFTGGTFAADLNTTAETADALAITGDLNLSGTALSLNDLGANAKLDLDTVLTLITYSGTWNGNVFTGYADDSQFNLGANRYEINYNDGNAVTLTAVPEPASTGLLLAGASLLLRRRRQKM